MKQHLVRILIGFALTGIFLWQAVWYRDAGLIGRLEGIVYDARLRLTMPGGVDERIVVLAIDDKSLQEIGRWPWSRDVMAGIVNRLFDDYQVGVVGFDIVFAETDNSSGLRVLDRLALQELKDNPAFQQTYRQLRPQLDTDALFSQALKGRPVVLGYYLGAGQDARRLGVIPEAVLPRGTFAGRKINFVTATGYGGNLPGLLKNSMTAGHFIPLVDEDGVVRRVPMLVELDGAYYESLSLAIVRSLQGLPKVEPGYPPDAFVHRGYTGLEWLRAGKVVIPVDDRVSALVPFRGGNYSFHHYPLADVAAGRVPAERLRGRIVLVGATAPALQDLRTTPVDKAYAGIEVHANLIAGMLDNTIKQKPPYVLGAELLLLFVLGIALSLAVARFSAFVATGVTAIAVILVTGANLLLWSYGNLVLPLASSLLLIAALYTVNMAYGYFVESRARHSMAELFGQYVPKELVDRMSRNPRHYSMEGREQVLTVLFSDIRDFTSISESLRAKELSAYINEYLTAMSIVIHERQGTLDKYIGDAIMAFWGAPVENSGHARAGVLTALAMQGRARALSEEFAARGWREVRIGIGVNSGTMRVGNMGSRLRQSYTVMGDPVNLGSRIEGLTKQYGVGILVGEETRNLAQGIVYREIDRVRVKGKDEAVAVFEPLGEEGEIGKDLLEELKLWNHFLRHYRAQDWDRAEVELLNLQRMNATCELYRKYAERISLLRRFPPDPDWDGVTKFETK